MDATTLTSQLRAVTGFDTDAISDADLASIYAVALNEYLRYRPGLRLTNTTGQITTVANQPNYELPSDALWVIDVGWDPDLSGSYVDGGLIGQPYADIAPGTFDPLHPSELYVIYQRFFEHRTFSAGRWEIVNDQIWLIPVPLQSGSNVAVFYAKARTLLDLKDVKDQLFFELCKGHSQMRRAFDISNDSDWTAGSYHVGTGPARQMMKAAEATLRRARHLLANSATGQRTGPTMGMRSG